MVDRALCTLILPETRKLDLLADMLERRGIRSVRCPMVAIRDAPDSEPVVAWLERVSTGHCDDLILFTGEGLRRLLGVAKRAGLHDSFVTALNRIRIVTRGPKPVQALREIEVKPTIQAEEPTTEGIISTLSHYSLAGRTVAVQLYPDNPNERLFDFLREAGASPDPVLPYVYASEAEDRQVLEVVRQLATGEVDGIAFTSGPQIRRLWKVTQQAGREEELRQGLERGLVAALGPVVDEQLEKLGFHSDVTLKEGTYALKPFVSAIASTFEQQQ